MPTTIAWLSGIDLQAMLFLQAGNPGSVETKAVEDSIPTMTRLFDQLGLDSDPPSIQSFIAAHKPLPATITLADASFWNPSQAEFLRGEMEEDSDWAIVIERLNAALRAAS